MSKTTDFKELTKIYLDVSQDWDRCEDLEAEYKKGCEELAELVPDAELQEKIKDCFGMSLEMYQRQGFIRGFQYAARLFSEAQEKILAEVCSNE